MRQASPSPSAALRSVLPVALLLLALIGAPSASAQASPPAGSPQGDAAADPATLGPDAAAEERFFDEVTVSATLNPSAIRDTPGTVSVLDAETIEKRLVENAADLVKFEPGVYVESNINRVGLNGFNIRGIGGNRVMTQIDGVETSEQFDFGPFNVHQFDLDLDTLKSAEIVRSASSSLYGSDALGGVVSFFTKDPADYLAGRGLRIAGKATYDGRSRNTTGNLVIAGGKDRLQASLFTSYGYGHEPRNRGEIASEDTTRTALNPQDRRVSQALGKVVFTPSPGNTIRATGELSHNDIEVDAFSSRTVTSAGPARTAVADITSDDTMRRFRASVDQTLLDRGGMNRWSWSLYTQSSTTDQVVDEVRVTTGAGPSPITINRSGTLSYDQKSAGGALQGYKVLGRGGRLWQLSFGGSYHRHEFDMLRDRVDVNAATGAVVPTTALILPSKYFPKSDVGEGGAFVQLEARLGRLTLVPGVRYDRFSMNADENDPVFLATLSPPPTDFDEDAVSSKLGASLRVSEQLTIFGQYAAGFRAPPYSAINSGFTNLAGGYTSISNPELRSETSDNFEAGVRAALGPVSLSASGFWNNYDDFIDQVQRGVSPSTGLIEFQYQNVQKVAIDGLELRAEARLAEGLRLRASYAVIRGNDVSGPEKAPLNSVAPDQGVAGLEYSAPAGRFGGELSVRSVRAADEDAVGEGLFAPKSYAVADVTGWLRVSELLKLRLGILNVTDKKYFEWSNVRGRSAADPTLDRYSSPGLSAVASLSVGW